MPSQHKFLSDMGLGLQPVQTKRNERCSWEVNVMYYEHRSPYWVGGYVRILAQLLSAPKHAQRTITQQRTFSLPEEKFKYTQLQK